MVSLSKTFLGVVVVAVVVLAVVAATTTVSFCLSTLPFLRQNRQTVFVDCRNRYVTG